MLVLTRKVNEEIVIDGHIRITISQVKGDRVRIGITAPPHVRVDRAEIAKQLFGAEDRELALAGR